MRPDISFTKQTFLVLLIGTIILVGAGVGLTNQLSNEDQTVTTSTPTPPTVTVTSPETSTPSEPNVTPTAGNSSPAETAAGTTSTETTTEPTATPARSDPVTADLTVSATNPSDVANAEGRVAGVRGTISGTLSWKGDVDSVVIVVSAWSPRGGWVEKRRATVIPSGKSVTLADVIDHTTLLYATGERAQHFDNPTDATTVTREGYVSVTAVLLADNETMERVDKIASYRFDVTNVGTVDVVLTNLDEGEAVVNVADVSPGENGSRTVAIKNNGTTNGKVKLLLRSVSGRENGFTDAEAAVDDDEDSELPGAFALRIAIVTDQGRRYLFGSPDRYVPIKTSLSPLLGSFPLPAEHFERIVLEWRITSAAGNSVMSDTISFDLQFVLLGG